MVGNNNNFQPTHKMRGSAGIGAGSSTTGSALGRPASRAAGMSSPTAAPRRLDSGGGSGSGGGGGGGGGGGSAAPSIPRLRFTTADLTMGATLGAWVRRDAVLVLGCNAFLFLFTWLHAPEVRASTLRALVVGWVVLVHLFDPP